MEFKFYLSAYHAGLRMYPAGFSIMRESVGVFVLMPC